MTGVGLAQQAMVAVLFMTVLQNHLQEEHAAVVRAPGRHRPGGDGKPAAYVPTPCTHAHAHAQPRSVQVLQVP